MFPFRRKRARRIEIQVYSHGTGRPGYYRFSPLKLLWWLVGVAVAVAGIVYFNPMSIWDKATDFRLWQLYKENMALQRTVSQAKGAARNAQGELEESAWLREKVGKMAGLPENQADSAPEKSERELREERLSGKNLLRIREAHNTFKHFRAALWDDPDFAESVPMLHPLRDHQRVGNRFALIEDRFTGQSLPHRGIDYVAPEGDTVIATGGGVVSQVSTERGFGLSVKIRHGDHMESFYAHLSKALVNEGRPVRRGAPIGLVGKSGRATGALLHYEVRLKGQPINPEDYYLTP